jgi:hypothetical protein
MQKDYSTVKKIHFLLCMLLAAVVLFAASSPLFLHNACFIFTEEDSVTLIKYTGRAKRVSVPACLNGKEVSQISPIAFSGNRVIEEIIFPKTITLFDMRSIEGCLSLKRIVFQAETLTLTYKKFLLSGVTLQNICPNLEIIHLIRIKDRQNLSIDFPLNTIRIKMSGTLFSQQNHSLSFLACNPLYALF